VVAVPTPVDQANAPDLTHLLDASRTVGRAIAAGGIRSPAPIVCFESTVCPGCTEERCVPALEEASGLSLGQGFELGYSPERISPADPDHTIYKVIKIVSGRTPETLRVIPPDCQGGPVRGGGHPHGGSRQSDRECPERSEYRSGERAIDAVQPDGYQH
jgi:UDP-N-acetyl-D-galactosamine dehydrogenase